MGLLLAAIYRLLKRGLDWMIFYLVWPISSFFCDGNAFWKFLISTIVHLQRVRTCSHRRNRVPVAFGMITICQNAFPSLFPLFCDGNAFWRIENAGNIGKMSLKTRFHRQNCTKMPLNSLKTMPRAWKMVPQSDSPMGEHFSGALVDFPWQTEVK